MEDYRVFLVIGLFAIGGAVLTFVFSLLKKKLLTYIPTMIAGVLTLFSVIAIFTNKDTTGWSDLGYLAGSMLFGGAFLGSLLTAVIINKKKH